MLLRRARRELEVLCVVPFTPYAYETGLETHDHVAVLLEDRLDVSDMHLNDLRGRVPRFLVLAVRVCETHYTFCSVLTENLHVLSHHLDEVIRDVAVHVLLRIEAKVADGPVLESVLLDLACRKKAGRSRLEALCKIESTLRVREDVVTLRERDMVEVAVVRKNLRIVLASIRHLILCKKRCYVSKV